MALDASAQKTNFYYSFKKYIIDNFYTNLGIQVIFDRFLPPNKSVPRWLFVVQGILNRDTLSDYTLEIYCVTRQDEEGVLLTELTDLVAGHFSGDTEQTDGLNRIPFYDASNGSQLGSMVITDCVESNSAEAPDQSKFLILTITAKMASKI